ncbi:hypothetical protein HBDW_35170 [Herbaspirillum sp. DW155]|uniref:hypothetical protein n=1 Tax=Herbaspirillum sp. DW155 TaxID=3095609 RepID=UPI00308636A8|nr:hypothetical protein HBDW_35170 [Herbaspirillum sp. DW155]
MSAAHGLFLADISISSAAGNDIPSQRQIDDRPPQTRRQNACRITTIRRRLEPAAG